LSEDQDIIQQCLKGKEDAYQTLYTKYKGYVYTTCIRYGIREYEIKDCMQTIFIEVFQALNKYDSNKASFKTWLTRIAINQLLNVLRKKKVRFDVIEPDDNILVFHDFTSHTSSEIDHKYIHHVISMMPESSRTVFNLYLLEGFSHKEIADSLGISLSQSRVLLHHGRTWAKQMLSHHFNDYTNENSYSDPKTRQDG
jgi:RNA polymerase sigma factor (sigma-70 family)